MIIVMIEPLAMIISFLPLIDMVVIGVFTITCVGVQMAPKWVEEVNY